MVAVPSVFVMHSAGPVLHVSSGCGEETPDQCAKGKSKGKDNRVRQQKRTTVVTSPSCSPPPTRPATPANERYTRHRRGPRNMGRRETHPCVVLGGHTMEAPLRAVRAQCRGRQASRKLGTVPGFVKPPFFEKTKCSFGGV